MRILVISYLFPFPANGGYKLRVYNTIKELSKNHTMDLFCFSDGNIKTSDLSHMQSICKSVYVIDKPDLSVSRKFYRYLKNMATKVPYVLFSAWDYEKQICLKNIVDKEHYDVVIAEHLISAHILYSLSFSQAISPALKVIINHNFESDLFKSVVYKQNRFFKPLNYFRHLFLRRYEKVVCDYFDFCVAMSEKDRKKFVEICPDKEFIELPNGVDIHFFQKRDELPLNKDLYYVGSFNYYPNIDAVLYFLDQIFPIIKSKVQDVRFFILGGNPPEQIRQYHDGKSVLVLGYQDDIRTMALQCRASVVPLRLGGGTRLKITEAMSMGIPIVSTRKGVEGLRVEDEKHLYIADTPDRFAEKTIQLLENDQNAETISNNGRALMEKEYSWHKICGQFVDHIYKALPVNLS